MRRVIGTWTGLLALAAIASAGWMGHAQEQRLPRADVRVISGADIGFRVEGRDIRTGNPTGTWVVRIDGEWVPAGPSIGVRPAK